jgi:hypothetical protein
MIKGEDQNVGNANQVQQLRPAANSLLNLFVGGGRLLLVDESRHGRGAE